ncbi:hypothetical protein TNCV_1846631 [Trichonephila clavipes]|nr:hypothetical protein TNCV_1846631 [Trichonephila clavipes]
MIGKDEGLTRNSWWSTGYGISGLMALPSSLIGFKAYSGPMVTMFRVEVEIDFPTHEALDPRSCKLDSKRVTKMAMDTLFEPPGWLGWFVAGPLHPRLRVQPRPKSVEFYDAENRQRSCRMIIRHVKDPLALVLSAKLNPSVGSCRQSSGAFLWGRNWASKLPVVVGVRL